jgi:hypothetical protein
VVFIARPFPHKTTEAALRGRKLKDLVEEGLRLVLAPPRESHRRRSLAALMKGPRGVVDSGVPDLPANVPI